MNNKQLPASTPTEDSPIDWPYICTNCDRGFDATMAHQIDLIDDTEAELMCWWCRHTGTYDAPDAEEIERPPGIVDHAIVTNDDGLPTARLFFEGGAWLQYRQAPAGRVYEEMFNDDGEKIESFIPELDRDDCATPREYLHCEMDHVGTYTVRGLEIQRPHIADALIHSE